MSARRPTKRRRVRSLLGEVGLSKDAVDRYPHEFSGGQRQRIGLARALALDPKLIVADEPVSALDVSIQAQILNLMKDLQIRHGLTYVMISHDLAVIRYMADTIGVMYLGKVVELGPASEVYERPTHHYTVGLLDAVPEAEVEVARSKAASAGNRARGASLLHRSTIRVSFPNPLSGRPGSLRPTGAAHDRFRERAFRRLSLSGADTGLLVERPVELRLNTR